MTIMHNQPFGGAFTSHNDPLCTIVDTVSASRVSTHSTQRFSQTRHMLYQARSSPSSAHAFYTPAFPEPSPHAQTCNTYKAYTTHKLGSNSMQAAPRATSGRAIHVLVAKRSFSNPPEARLKFALHVPSACQIQHTGVGAGDLIRHASLLRRCGCCRSSRPPFQSRWSLHQQTACTSCTWRTFRRYARTRQMPTGPSR